MTKEKQIEIPEDEMGMSGYSKFAWELWQQLKLPMDICEKVDRFVREQGYLKQSEGEWVDNHCTVCGMTPIGEETWTRNGETPPKFERCMSYCPHCGAKMKGGE